MHFTFTGWGERVGDRVMCGPSVGRGGGMVRRAGQCMVIQNHTPCVFDPCSTLARPLPSSCLPHRVADAFDRLQSARGRPLGPPGGRLPCCQAVRGPRSCGGACAEGGCAGGEACSRQPRDQILSCLWGVGIDCIICPPIDYPTRGRQACNSRHQRDPDLIRH